MKTKIDELRKQIEDYELHPHRMVMATRDLLPFLDIIEKQHKAIYTASYLSEQLPNLTIYRNLKEATKETTEMIEGVEL